MPATAPPGPTNVIVAVPDWSGSLTLALAAVDTATLVAPLAGLVETTVGGVTSAVGENTTSTQ